MSLSELVTTMYTIDEKTQLLKPIPTGKITFPGFDGGYTIGQIRGLEIILLISFQTVCTNWLLLVCILRTLIRSN